MSLKMVALLVFHLLVTFVGRTSSGVVPQNFKSPHNEPSHLEEIFTNNGTHVSNTTAENSELHNETSSVLVDVENLNASHVSITDLHNISDSDNFKNTIPEESHVVKNISTGSGRSKKKVSKEPKKKRESFNKTVREESDHGDANNMKSSASIQDHSDDFRQNNVSKVFDDHVEHVTNNHFDNISDHSEDLTIKSDNLNNLSISFDHDVNVVNTEFNTSLLGDGNHLEEVINDTNHFDSDHLNDSVVDFKKHLNELTNNVSKEFNDTLEIASELNNFTQTTSDALKTSEKQTDQFGHMENSQNTSIQLNQAAVSLSNSSKLFLNIHNSFMKLNRTDKTDSALLNHIDGASSENASNIHDRLHTAIIDEESFDKISETNISSEGSKSSEILTDILPNITRKIDSTNISVSDMKEMGVGHKDNKPGHVTNADILDTVAPNEDDINVTSELPGELGEIIVNINEPDSLNSDIKKPIVVGETNETQGLFSSLGLDFLMNSELAKNAASAMEVFNFSDSALTDHIVDDKNDMHDFLDLIPLEHNDNRSKSDQTHTTSSTIEAESSTLVTESSTLVTESFTLVTESFTLVTESSTLVTESSTLVTESSTLDAESSSSSENGSFDVLTTTPSYPILNSTVEFEVTTLPSQIILNSTVEYEVTTMPSQLFLNSTIEYEATTTISPPMLRNGTGNANDAKCPPPGFCIFWFLGQDTCTVNSHCLGSRICCRIGCTKTCIEV